MPGVEVLGGSLLHVAAVQDDAHAISSLLAAAKAMSNGSRDMVLAAVNRPDAAGRTPLHLAAREGSSHAAALLLAGGSDPNASATLGQTPLHEAPLGAPNGAIELAWRLIDAACNLNTTNRAGDTPLHLAAHYGHAGLCSLLIARNADPWQRGACGMTALNVAMERQQSEAVQRLRGFRQLCLRVQDPFRAEGAWLLCTVHVPEIASVAEMCSRIASALEHQFATPDGNPLVWHTCELFRMDGAKGQTGRGWTEPHTAQDFWPSDSGNSELLMRITPKGCSLIDSLSVASCWRSQPWRLNFESGQEGLRWERSSDGWMTASVPEWSPLAGLICRAFDRRSLNRRARIGGVRLLRHRDWLPVFEATLSKLEGLWPNAVSDDPALGARLRRLGHLSMAKEGDDANDDAYRLFCESACLHTGRTHFQPRRDGPPEGLLRPCDVVPRLAWDFKELFGEQNVSLSKTQLSLVWQGEVGGTARLRRCLEDPRRLTKEADPQGFPLPVHVAPSPDTAEGCGSGAAKEETDLHSADDNRYTSRFGGTFPMSSTTQHGGTVLVYILASRFCFPGTKRAYQPFFRPVTSMQPYDHVTHRGSVLEPGFDTYVVFSGGRGLAKPSRKGWPSDYELVVADAAQLLPLAAVDFVLEPHNGQACQPLGAGSNFGARAAAERGFGVSGAAPGMKVAATHHGRLPALRLSS